ncbi:sulfite exporter TauE/SafE family protein, partial [Methylophaga sp.]
VGIMLLAGLSIMTNTDIHNSNAIKNLMSVMLTTIASLFYWMADLIDFNLLFMMGISALFGGYLGSRLSYSLSQKNFRVIIIFLGCVMTLIYFNR